MIPLSDKILILDGAMGTMIQRYGLGADDYHAGPFSSFSNDLQGNNECLNLTRPEVIKAIHKEYIAAGADIIETNTFSANRISQAEYSCEEFAAEMAYQGARLAREAADESAAMAASVGLSRKVWVAGSIGPTSKSLSLSPDASDPSFRPYSFEMMREAYREQAEALIRGGVDLLLIETCFDALNVKAALAGIAAACSGGCVYEDPRLSDGQAPPSRGWHVFSNTIPHCTSPAHNTPNGATLMGVPEERNSMEGVPAGRGSEVRMPVVVSVSVGDRSGRTLTGQTLEAFYTAVRHYPIAAFGLNCSLGASEMMPLVEEINSWCKCGVSCYPNAGLPNEMGGYDQSPDEMAAQVRELASRGLVNIVGGCCGTTPDHIRAIAKAVSGLTPRPLSIKTSDFMDINTKTDDKSIKTGHFMDTSREILTVSGLEAVKVDVKTSNFTNVGERTNVAGSRKFARLISEGKYDEALQIAAKQIEDGASIIDINMDDAMLNSTREMERFVRYISNDPAVAKAALMIDSSHWETIVAGLQNAQGKCIVNSISLKEGAEAFVEKARIINSYGAAIVVMAFDEQGQATTYDRKIEICQRAYKLLTEEAGISSSDIIFDVNILSIGTGIEEHARYAIDFIEAVRWIKNNLPGALTSGGVSNLSFAFRGNNTVREAMHSAFLYHAIKAGLDMAIANPSMLQVYDEIDPELLKCVEDVIFNTDSQATERLIEKATSISMVSGSAQGVTSTSYVSISQSEAKDYPKLPVSQRLQNALIKGRTETLVDDLQEALAEYGSAVSIIEGPLMEGMEAVGKLFGDGKMFLPQVVKSAKVMRDAVETLFIAEGGMPSPLHAQNIQQRNSAASVRQKVVLATVKGDVHDIGKNITGIVLTCNGFDVHDLGVMVDKETILDEAQKLNADIIAVSGLITPSLYQMEELCREMSARGMTTPLLIGGATTSALHTAVKLAPLYNHVFYGADASAAAVLAKKCMIDREAFEAEQHLEQQKLRDLYNKTEAEVPAEGTTNNAEESQIVQRFETESYTSTIPTDIPVQEIALEEVLPYFDWKMFYAIWGVKYGSAVPEAMELMQLRRDAEDELAVADFKIMLSARFFPACANKSDEICFTADGKNLKWPMMRQEVDKHMSLCDFVIPESSGKKSAFGMFAICVHKRSKAHVEGCSCPACSNAYEDMIGKAVRMTLAESASLWLDALLLQGPLPVWRQAPPSRGWHVLSTTKTSNHQNSSGNAKIIKPAIGYSSCPDHTLKGDVLKILEGSVAHQHEQHNHKDGHCTCGHNHGHTHSHNCGCGQDHAHNHTGPLGIQVTESYAMTPEASICGLMFMHPEATYPQIRCISQKQYDNYVERRGMDETTARRFLGHLLK